MKIAPISDKLLCVLDKSNLLRFLNTETNNIESDI